MNLFAVKSTGPLDRVRLATGAVCLVTGALLCGSVAVRVVAAASAEPDNRRELAPATTPSSEQEAEATSHDYDAHGRRDPFVNPVARVRGPKLDGTPGLDVEAIELTGIVSTPAGFTAMISGPDHTSYFVRVGERFYNGRLVGIDASSLTFEVDETNPLVERTSRSVVVPLHPMEK